jgi:hypothetical protein
MCRRSKRNNALIPVIRDVAAKIHDVKILSDVKYPVDVTGADSSGNNIEGIDRT